MPNVMATQDEGCQMWQFTPDSILYQVFSYLAPRDLLNAGQVCKTWQRVTMDDFLWRDLLYSVWKIEHSIPMAQGKSSWVSEFKRLYSHTPKLESEVLKEHRDQVLHVSFSHNGDYFATSSKDGYVKVWTSGYPATVKYYADMRELSWKYTQFSQFNDSDSLLLVSGVHFGSHSTSGEIAVFNLIGGFELQCRVLNKPYDIFGTWYNESYLLSGNLHWLGHLTSCSVLWLNKASQAVESEQESVVMKLYKFRNINASSIRTIMIAKCMDTPQDSRDGNTSGSSDACESRKRKMCDDATIEGTDTSHSECSQRSARRNNRQKLSQKMQFYSDGAYNIKLLEVDDETCDQDSTIEYNMNYRMAESNMAGPSGEEVTASCSSQAAEITKNESDSESIDNDIALPVGSGLTGQGCGPEEHMHPLPLPMTYSDTCLHSGVLPPSSNIDMSSPGSPMSMRSVGSPDGGSASNTNSLHHAPNGNDNAMYEHSMFSPRDLSSSSSSRSESQVAAAASVRDTGDKYLIFTTGMKTYTPHQIGIKRIRSMDAAKKMEQKTPTEGRMTVLGGQQVDNMEYELAGEEPMPPLAVVQDGVDGHAPHPVPPHDVPAHNGAGPGREEFDTVDHLIELHGHIIGMCLSPDHRYLYVNSRPWPKDYEIEDPLYPPPIAQEIDIHVIDLLTMHEVGTMHRAHKAYTPNDECFFIFLDVCDEYVASGAEDKHGYLWDRHYGVCLTRFPHNDVVNSVAFNPADPEMLITASDDHSLKIWRSRHRERQVKGKLPTSFKSTELNINESCPNEASSADRWSCHMLN